MPVITQKDAINIAQKLKAHYKDGGKHKLAMIYYEGRKIAQFGIRHDRTASHNYINQQIYMSLRDCLIFSQCKISYEEWVEKMQEKGLIEVNKDVPLGNNIDNTDDL